MHVEADARGERRRARPSGGDRGQDHGDEEDGAGAHGPRGYTRSPAGTPAPGGIGRAERGLGPGVAGYASAPVDRHPLALCGAALAVFVAGATAAALPGNVRGPPGGPAAHTGTGIAGAAAPAARRPARRPVRPLRRPAVANLSGPPGLIAPAAKGADWADADGLGFPNSGSSSNDRWANYVSLYGPAQTYVCGPSPVAQGGPVCARNPEAVEMLDAFNAQGLAVGGGRGGFGAGGECFGFSSTAILFSLSADDPAWTGRAFPRAQLVRRGGLSALTGESTAAIGNRTRRRRAIQQYRSLRDTVRERQLLQSSWTYQSWWEQWAAAHPNLDGPTLYSVLAGPIGAGQSMGMGIFWTTPDGVAEGHELVARGLSGSPSRFVVSVYDPNYPLQPGPRIVVAGGQWWTENDPDGLYPHSDRPQPLSRGGTSPTIMMLGQDQMALRTPAAWWSVDRQGAPSPLISQAGTARPAGRVYLQAGAGRIVQVTDERGRRALAPDGGPNGSPASGIPGTLVRVGVEAPTTVILPSGPRYAVTLAAGRRGAGQLSVWDRGGLSVVSGRGRTGGGLVAGVDGTAADVSATPGRGTRVGVAVVRRIGAGRFRSAESAPALGRGLGQSRPAGRGAPGPSAWRSTVPVR